MLEPFLARCIARHRRLYCGEADTWVCLEKAEMFLQLLLGFGGIWRDLEVMTAKSNIGGPLPCSALSFIDCVSTGVHPTFYFHTLQTIAIRSIIVASLPRSQGFVSCLGSRIII